jgi:hypothetical protein
MSTDERLARITAALLTLQELLPALGPATLGMEPPPEEEMELVCGAGLSIQTRAELLVEGVHARRAPWLQELVDALRAAGADEEAWQATNQALLHVTSALLHDLHAPDRAALLEAARQERARADELAATLPLRRLHDKVRALERERPEDAVVAALLLEHVEERKEWLQQRSRWLGEHRATGLERWRAALRARLAPGVRDLGAARALRQQPRRAAAPRPPEPRPLLAHLTPEERKEREWREQAYARLARLMQEVSLPFHVGKAYGDFDLAITYLSRADPERALAYLDGRQAANYAVDLDLALRLCLRCEEIMAMMLSQGPHLVPPTGTHE